MTQERTLSTYLRELGSAAARPQMTRDCARFCTG